MKKISKKIVIIGLGLLLLAIFLRIYKLTIIPVFADEAIYVRWAQVMRAEQTLRFLPLSDGKQPLFMWVVIPFLKIFSDPLFAGRFVSVLTGVGTLAGVFVLSMVLFRNIKISSVAGLIYTISPFSIFFDRLALADSMLSFFGVWTLVFAIITVKRIRLDSAMITGFSLGGSLLTKSPGIYFALMLPATFILSIWPKKLKDRFLKTSIYVFLFTFSYIIAYAIYNILRLGPNFQMIAIRNKDYVYPISHLFTSPMDPLKPFMDRSLEYFLILGPSVLVVLIIFGIFRGLKKYPLETIVIAIWGFLPIIISSEFSKTMTARYIYFSLPYFFIIAALSVQKTDIQKWKGIFNKMLIILFLAFITQSFILDFRLLTDPQKANLPRSERSGYLEDWTSGYGIKEVSNYILNQYLQDPDRKIVIGTEGYFGTLPDGLQIYLNNRPEIIVIGVGEPIREIPNSLYESKNAGNSTYLVINSTRMLAKPDTPGLNLISFYPKAVRPDGTQEKLLLFELN